MGQSEIPLLWYNGCFLGFSLPFVYRNVSDQSREAEIQGEDDDCTETDRLLGDEGGSEDEITENISIRLKKKTKKQKKKQKKEKKASLLRTLWSGLFGVSFMMAVFCKLLHDALIFIQPQLIR